MSTELDHLYMKMALNMSTISHGVRNKVGAIAVTSNGVLLTGVNGLPSALGNNLEYSGYGCINLDELISSGELVVNDGDTHKALSIPKLGLISKVETIHAELNVILKSAREGVSIINSTIYTTLSPCVACASMLASAGVSRVVYLNEYRITTGVDILKQCGIIVDKLEFEMVEYNV